MSYYRVMEYVDKMVSCNTEEERHELLEKEGKDHITLDDAAHLVLQLSADLDDYFQEFHETSVKLQEMRLAAVIQALPQDVQENIKKKFEEVEDDLLNEDNEGDE
ncbi:hypothetical protein BSP38_114 [Bacillus phage BSP38]|uniref:Uncharacterized protein n=1 Tax=Bacillus phage BSP38 TaxID=2283013 RepID=A0A345MJX4_BPBSP|nr:hypothetical protein HWB82_gp204 [Bacillus phage BSP38]AXH71156.1 hypothetical protein BSP38_114 [Bacillus phage BSP38]